MSVDASRQSYMRHPLVHPASSFFPAREEADSVMGQTLVHAHKWRVACLFFLFLNIVLALIFLLLQFGSKQSVYAVATHKNGYTVNAGFISEKMVPNAQFMHLFTQQFLDAYVHKNQEALALYSTGTAYKALNAKSLCVQNKDCSIQVEQVYMLKPYVYQIDWSTKAKGGSKQNFRAQFVMQQNFSKQHTNIKLNPFSLVVKKIVFLQDKGKGGTHAG